MTRKKWMLIAAVGSTCVVLFAVHSYTHPAYKPPPVSFSGDSSTAKQTVVVPTLDTPMPKGKNVIWCGTIQLCWDGLKALLGMQLPTDTDACKRMSAAKMNQADLPPSEFYTAAGWIKDGIVQKIQTEMAAKFPKVKPDVGLSDGDAAAMAYAFLAAQVKFTTPYFDRDGGDEFTDSAGNKTRVSTFGMFHQGEADINRDLARQIQVLYTEEDGEFALDLDKNSNPNQLILAGLPPKADLATLWNDLKTGMANAIPCRFSQFNTLVVPNVLFHIQQQFPELENGVVTHFRQSVDFRLDKSGAVLASEADGKAFGIGHEYNFTRPFLIVMRNRGATEPYFVMWVDNAELLCKQTAK